MASQYLDPCGPTVHVFVFILCACLQAVGAFSTFYPWSYLPDSPDNICKRSDLRYKNLFVSEEEIKNLVSHRYLYDNFKIKGLIARYKFDGVCDNTFKVWASNSRSLPSCPQAQFRFSDPCCATNMFIIVPQTVVSIYTGETLTVKHLPNNYQLLHQAECQSLGASCTNTGTCQITNRIQWILAIQNDGTEAFVPVTVPNHCYCQYT